MSKLKNLIAGLAGAVALNILHETLKKQSDNVPRVDLLGEDAMQRTLNYFGGNIDHKETLYNATLAGDIVGNTLYYSIIGAGNAKYLWPKVLFVGLSAGIGAVKLPKPMGLDETPVAKNDQVKFLTVGYYLFGAVVTGLVVKMISKSS
ncbi:hypothetical protein [Pedobacter hartonius]|uniref:Uncharacterized protein n=1 Tax=Pedobacter hartonius TaxID=425514 RepID=A0A1H4BPS1_9SPHI|nr:hypothetical protein [Pedobacter hartonius]SEA50175.1 hypothetical protein SAMN05443550_103428 [Pedobacter hartonius]